jgi:hypothetical protein
MVPLKAPKSAPKIPPGTATLTIMASVNQTAARRPAKRRRTPNKIETAVLMKSVRRCALCYHLDGDLSKKDGQVAHLDQDPSNFVEDNLCFLCLQHHSHYDSKTKQHKNYQMGEAKEARKKLYDAIRQNKHLATSAVAARGATAANNTARRAAPLGTRRNRTTTVKTKTHGLEFVAWGASGRHIDRYQVGTPSVIEVRNSCTGVPPVAEDVIAQVEFSNRATHQHFTIPSATWWETKNVGAAVISGWRSSTSLEAGESQCFVLYVTANSNGALWLYRGEAPLAVLDYGDWIVTLRLSSANATGFEGKIRLSWNAHTGLTWKFPVFTQTRRIPPRSRLALAL